MRRFHKMDSTHAYFRPNNCPRSSRIHPPYLGYPLISSCWTKQLQCLCLIGHKNLQCHSCHRGFLWSPTLCGRRKVFLGVKARRDRFRFWRSPGNSGGILENSASATHQSNSRTLELSSVITVTVVRTCEKL
jgi:hypothetical protein